MPAAGLKLFVDHFGPLPEHYLLLDLETTGFSPTKDAIVQVGCGAVADRVWVGGDARHLNWEAPGQAAAADLLRWQANDQACRAAMLEKHGVARPDWPARCRAGLAPADVLDRLAAVLAAGRGPVVGHGVAAFDVPFLVQAYAYCGRPTPPALDGENLLDSGSLLKACLMQQRPRPGESRAGYLARARAARVKGLKFGLWETAVPLLRLRDRPGFDRARPHEADGDCLATHYLIEALRACP